MILTIECSNCHDNVVNYKSEINIDLQLFCVRCGKDDFHARHEKITETNKFAIKQGIIKLRDLKYQADHYKMWAHIFFACLITLSITFGIVAYYMGGK